VKSLKFNFRLRSTEGCLDLEIFLLSIVLINQQEQFFELVLLILGALTVEFCVESVTGQLAIIISPLEFLIIIRSVVRIASVRLGRAKCQAFFQASMEKEVSTAG